jgi:hypothetical protein
MTGTCLARGCPPLPERSTRCHCPRCHQTFGTLTDFDDHSVRVSAVPLSWSCKVPEDMGLVRDSTGTWRTPEGLAARDRKTADLEALRTRVRAAGVALDDGDAAVAAYLLDEPVAAVERVSGG